MIYTIQASDEIIGKEYIKKIYEKNGIVNDLMNTLEFNAQETDIDTIIEYCFTTPFFSENKVAIIKNPIFLTAETDKKDYSEFIEKLMEYIENENKSTLLIIFSIYEKLDERKKIVKFLKENTQFKKIDTPNPNQLAKIVLKMFENNGCSISTNDVIYIIDRVGNNIIDLRQEVDKLVLYKPNSIITKEDIDDFVVYSSDISIFELSNAILEKNISKSLEIQEDLVKNGFEPIVLISILANQIRIALLAKYYQKMGFDQASIAKKVKVHPYRVKLAIKLGYSNDSLKQILKKLALLDYQIKIGKVNKHHGLKVFILSI